MLFSYLAFVKKIRILRHQLFYYSFELLVPYLQRNFLLSGSKEIGIKGELVAKIQFHCKSLI